MAEHPNTFHLVIASVGATQFDGAAVSATVPGAAGEFTILPNHEPIVTTLRPGTITVKTTLETKKYEVESGVLECSGSRVVVLL
jgi:F-type H+-transporting ATPase subunit epsilon